MVWNAYMRAESRGILRHIAHKYARQGNPDLIGTGALERASIEQWLQTEAQSFDVPSADVVYSLAYLPAATTQPNKGAAAADGGRCEEEKNDDGGRDRQYSSQRQGGAGAGGGRDGQMAAAHRQKVEEMKQLFEKSSKELSKVLDIYEQRLEEAAYLAGDKFTIADLSHLPNADRLASDPRSRRMFEARKNVSRWWNNISSRESWEYVKSLQRPPSAAHAGNAQQQQQQQSPSAGNNYQHQQGQGQGQQHYRNEQVENYNN